MYLKVQVDATSRASACGTRGEITGYTILVSVQPVKRVTLADQISNGLMDAIMDGSLGMGEKLKTQELADKFGVSRMPVREALIALENTGLIETTPYSGYRVAYLDQNRIREVYMIRAALEPIVGEAACEKIQDAQIVELNVIFDELKKATLGEAAASKEVYLRNREFHFTLYKASGLDEVVSAIRTAWNKIAVYKLLYSKKYVTNPEAGQAMLNEHRKLLDAVEAHDCARISELLSSSIRHHRVVVPEEFEQTV
jgi:DNA-binding GntR family transcriptional regulator